LNLDRWSVYAAIIGLLALVSLYPVAKRAAVENANRQVALAAEYDVIEALAAGEGLTMPEAFKRLREAGLNAVVLGEATIGELISRGQLSLVRTTVPGAPGEPGAQVVTLEFIDPSVAGRVQKGLAIRFGDLAGRLQVRDGRLALPDLDLGLVRATPVGLDPEPVRRAGREGILIARATNYSGVSERSIRETLEWFARDGATIFLPQGEQVLGRKDALAVTRQELRRLNMAYASPEFSKIAGDSGMVAADPGNVLRLHTAQVAELDRLDANSVTDRYVKAARERNSRILLLRPASLAAPKPLDAFAGQLRAVGRGLAREGLSVGTPVNHENPGVERGYYVLMQAVGGLFAVAAARAAGLPARWAQAGAILALLAAPLGLTGIGREGMSLLVALAAPFLGLVLICRFPPPMGLPRLVRNGFAFLNACAVSLAGGLFVAGEMSELAHLVKAEEFRGTKVAVFLPIVAVGLWYLARMANFRDIWKSPIRWGAAAIGIGVVAVLAVLVARTGNDGGVGAAGFELMFRGALDDALHVRPRTKEFLVGHPALWLGAGFLYAAMADPENDRLRAFAVLLMATAAIGQTGIVNTLCHGHVPVTLSLARIGIGMVLGSAIGALLWMAVRPKRSALGGA
jgi:hypothetical protein